MQVGENEEVGGPTLCRSWKNTEYCGVLLKIAGKLLAQRSLNLPTKFKVHQNEANHAYLVRPFHFKGLVWGHLAR